MADRIHYFFETDAAQYEAHASSHADLGDELYQETAKALSLKGASLLLDLWCCTGRELDEIMKKSPWVSVTGMDPSPARLAKLLAKPYASRLTLLNCDIRVAPFGKAIYDGAVAVMTMHHYMDADRLAIYQKIFEALHVGGRYVETDMVAADEAEEAAFRADWRPNDAAHCELPITANKIEALLREAGFLHVERRMDQMNRAIFVAGKEPI